MPAPAPLPDARAVRERTVAAFTRLGELPETDSLNKAAAAVARQLLVQGEEIRRQDETRLADIRAVIHRDPPLGIDELEIDIRIAQVKDLRLVKVYGDLLPRAYNESLAGEGELLKSRTSDYPVPTAVPDDEYQRLYAPLSRQLTCMALKRDPAFDPSVKPGFCDGVPAP